MSGESFQSEPTRDMDLPMSVAEATARLNKLKGTDSFLLMTFHEVESGGMQGSVHRQTVGHNIGFVQAAGFVQTALQWFLGDRV